MLRYENKGTAIEIRLPENLYKNYAVVSTFKANEYIANSSKNTKQKFTITLVLLETSIEDKLPIKEQNINTQEIISSFAAIKTDICKIVEQCCNNGFFNKYVERYEYYIKCFEIGNEILEKERLSKCQN